MKKGKVVAAIHQPNFFPWLGFFDKIVRSDVFVILDHVSNNPRSSIWTKRVQILCNQVPFWLTVPLKRPKGTEFLSPINQMVVNNELNYKDKHLKTIQLNYGKLPYYSEVSHLLDEFYNHESDFIAERNLSFITKVCELLEIKRTFIISSELNCQAASNELLVEICEKVNADAYIYGRGASNYQENEFFEKQGVTPIAQNFVHPTYQQLNSKEFISGLSIVDVLMNSGIEGTKKLLNL